MLALCYSMYIEVFFCFTYEQFMILATMNYKVIVKLSGLIPCSLYPAIVLVG